MLCPTEPEFVTLDASSNVTILPVTVPALFAVEPLPLVKTLTLTVVPGEIVQALWLTPAMHGACAWASGSACGEASQANAIRNQVRLTVIKSSTESMMTDGIDADV